MRPAVLCAVELFCFLALVPLLAVTMPDFAPRRVLLLAGCLYVIFRLRGKVEWRRLLARPSKVLLRGALGRGILVATVTFLYVYGFESEHLFEFPLRRPRLWLLIFFFYPLLSALPQEVIYRVYIFEAFEPLRRHPWVAFWISAAAFGWVHVIYAGWFAVLTSAGIGLILAGVYQKHRGEPGLLTALLVEHSLYGLAVFTLGLGRYFYLAR